MRKVILLCTTLISMTSLAPAFNLTKPTTNWAAAGASGSLAGIMAMLATTSYNNYRKLLREIALAKIDEGYAQNDSDRSIAAIRNRALNRRKRLAINKALYLGVPASVLGLTAAGFTGNGVWQSSRPDPNKLLNRPIK